MRAKINIICERTKNFSQLFGNYAESSYLCLRRKMKKLDMELGQLSQNKDYQRP